MAPDDRGHPAEALPAAVNNQGLFSDFYLTELVRDDEFFQNSAKDAELAWLVMKSLYNKMKSQLTTANEAQTEQIFIRPVLDALGHKDSYAVQPDVPSAEGARRPDYAFFALVEDLEEAEAAAKGKTEYFAKALAVGDAKAWDRSLDHKRKGGRDAFDNTAPSYQIDYYLRATDRKWGILTNGRRWRLYHRDSSYRMNVFYEVELVAMLEQYSDDFLYFFAFFRKEALATGFLDRVLSSSRNYAARLGDELKDNVYEALRLLAEGLLTCRDNNLDPQDLDQIRANTFVLIYRILFLFYADLSTRPGRPTTMDLTVAACGLALLFNCPQCGFELMASAAACPDCGRSFMRVCPNCGERAFGPAVRCEHCGHELHLEGRQVASFVDVAGVLPMVICPACETKYARSQGVCPECKTRICTQCGLVLEIDETHCPRCGAEGPPLPTFECPVCGATLPVGSGECTSCGAALCPNCGGAVEEDAVECFRCGAKIGLYCPECGQEVGENDVRCPHCGVEFEEA